MFDEQEDDLRREGGRTRRKVQPSVRLKAQVQIVSHTLARISCAVVPISQLRPRMRVPALESDAYQPRFALRPLKTKHLVIIVLNEALSRPARINTLTTYL
jgi:hypothetical protein